MIDDNSGRASGNVQQTGGEIPVGNRCRIAAEDPEKPLEKPGRFHRAADAFERAAAQRIVVLFGACHSQREAQSGAVQESYHAQGLQHQRQNQLNRRSSIAANSSLLAGMIDSSSDRFLFKKSSQTVCRRILKLVSFERLFIGENLSGISLV